MPYPFRRGSFDLIKRVYLLGSVHWYFAQEHLLARIPSSLCAHVERPLCSDSSRNVKICPTLMILPNYVSTPLHQPSKRALEIFTSVLKRVAQISIRTFLCNQLVQHSFPVFVPGGEICSCVTEDGQGREKRFYCGTVRVKGWTACH